MTRQVLVEPILVDLIRAGYPVKRTRKPGKTRPTEHVIINDCEFTLAQYHAAHEHVKKNPIAAVNLPEPVVMTPEEFSTFSRMAVPELMHKLYNMARASEDPKVVLATVKEFMDRGFGKATQSIEVNLGPDVRGAWKQLENFDRPVIDSNLFDAKIEDTEDYVKIT